MLDKTYSSISTSVSRVFPLDFKSPSEEREFSVQSVNDKRITNFPASPRVKLGSFGVPRSIRRCGNVSKEDLIPQRDKVFHYLATHGIQVGGREGKGGWVRLPGLLCYKTKKWIECRDVDGCCGWVDEGG